MSGVLVTKLLPPYIESTMMNRPRLIDLAGPLEKRKIFLFSAPAGYGKTVFMSQLVQNISKPLIWYQLDVYDNDAAVFLQHFVAGIRQHISGFGSEILPILEQGELTSKLRLLLLTIINEMTAKIKQGLVIVLDDFHAINEPALHHFIEELAKKLPPGIMIMIAGRTAFPFSFSRLRVSGQVVVFGSEELRFSRQEIKTFLEQRLKSISAEIAAALENETAGWPVAIRLAGEYNLEDRILTLEKKHQEIYPYLASEVLRDLPVDIREFLLVTSVLDIITPDICNRFLERDNSHQILSYLEKQQLFLIPLTGKNRVYRYHQLFQEFLLEQLGKRKRDLLRRAGFLAQSMGELDKAVEYLLAAGFETSILSILQEAARRALLQGRWQTVSRWLESVPDDRIKNEPWLSLFRAQVEMYYGRLVDACNWADKAVEGFTTYDNPEGLAESWVIQARILRYTGRYQDGLTLLKQAEPVLMVDNYLRFDIPIEKYLGSIMTCRFNDAEQILTAALEKAKQENAGHIIAHLAEGLGNTYYVQGKSTEALRMYRLGEDSASDKNLPHYYVQDFIVYIYTDWGELDLALEYAKRNVLSKEKLGLTETLPSSYACLGYVYFRLGEYKLVEECCRRAIQLMAEYGTERYFLLLNEIALSYALCMQGRWVEARDSTEKTLLEAGKQKDLIWAVCSVLAGVTYTQMGLFEEALSLLHQGIGPLEQAGYKVRLCEGYKALAWINFNQEAIPAAQGYARKCLEIGAEINYLENFLAASGDILLPSLRYGLENGVEVSYIQKILIRLDSRSLNLLLELAAAPDPEVRYRVIAPLAEIGGKQAHQVLASLMADSDLKVRRHALLRVENFNNQTGLSQGSTRESVGPPEPVLQVKTFGTFQVFAGEVEITGWRTKKTLHLFAYLAHCQEPVSKEKVLDDLWPGIDPAQADGLFRTNLYYLRQLLIDCNWSDLVQYQNGKYRLKSNGYQLDRHCFEGLVTTGLLNNTDPKIAIDYLEKAIAFYKGDYLADFDYPWLLPCQLNLKQLYLNTRQRLADYYFEQKEYFRVIEHLSIITNIDPYQEEAYRLLMKSHAALGNRQAVREQYQTLKEVLGKEIGLEPSSETRDLYEKLCK